MTRYELLTIVSSFQSNCMRQSTKSEILRTIHSFNNIECKIGNPEWYVLSLTKLRRMLLKISDDLSLESFKICEMSKEKILKILFSLDVMFQCYMYSIDQHIYDTNRLIDVPEIQKKFIYLGASMGKDLSYFINPSTSVSGDVPLRIFIKNKYFGKFADISKMTRYAIAYEHFKNENKYEFMLKKLRQRQIFQEQQLHEIRRIHDFLLTQSQTQLNNEVNNEVNNELNNEIEAIQPVNISQINKQINKSIFKFKLPKWLLKFKIQFNNKNDELLIDASCSVCYMSKKNILFTDCGHISVCVLCSEKLGFKCPMCRKISSSKILVFY